MVFHCLGDIRLFGAEAFVQSLRGCWAVRDGPLGHRLVIKNLLVFLDTDHFGF